MSAHKATKQELIEADMYRDKSEALKAVVENHKQRLVLWEQENASLRKRITDLDANSIHAASFQVSVTCVW